MKIVDLTGLFFKQQDNDPLITQSPWRNKLPGAEGDTLGGFPVNFLVQVVRNSCQIEN